MATAVFIRVSLGAQMTSLHPVMPISGKSRQAYAVSKTDYGATRSRLERGCTTLLFRLLFRGLPFALDFGDGDLRPMSDQGAEFHFAPPRFLTLISILVNPGLRLGETFMQGSWHLTKGNLAQFLLMLVTEKRSAKKQHGLTFGLLQAINHYYKQFLTTFTATRKVAEHYDENTRFFELMMDADLVYTCGFFDETHDNLHDVQQNKFDVIFERLRIRQAAELNILDIGCGWGSFENFFPPDLAANIDGISLSQVQVDYARSTHQTKNTNQDLQVNFIKEDYRTFCSNPVKNTIGSYQLACSKRSVVLNTNIFFRPLKTF